LSGTILFPFEVEEHMFVRPRRRKGEKGKIRTFQNYNLNVNVELRRCLVSTLRGLLLFDSTVCDLISSMKETIIASCK